jgi:hypothetical protein
MIHLFRFIDYILRKFNLCVVCEIDLEAPAGKHKLKKIYIDKVW